jgi:hypothetical protein
LFDRIVALKRALMDTFATRPSRRFTAASLSRTNRGLISSIAAIISIEMIAAGGAYQNASRYGRGKVSSN